MTDLFTEQKWNGEFFLPDSNDKVLGEVSYSAEDGITLSYTITDKGNIENAKILHGILSSNDKCTIIGDLYPHLISVHSRNGLITKSGKSRYSFLVVGDFLSQQEKFSKVIFSLTNFQEFFSDFSNEIVEFRETPTYSVEVSFGKIEIFHTANSRYLSDDLIHNIYSQNEKALNEFKLAMNSIQSNYPNAFFLIRENIDYRVSIEFSQAVEISEVYKHVMEFSDLFALLLYKPVYPNHIEVIKNGSGSSSYALQIYPSMYLEMRTKQLCTQEYHHKHLPTTQFSIPLDKVILGWFKDTQAYSQIISSIQNETGFYDSKIVYGSLVLYATQLESINNYCAEKSHKTKKEKKELKTDKKYEYPLKKHSNKRINNKLMSIFGTSSLEETATAIGDLRNEIAHIHRPRNWLKKLLLNELLEVSQCLQLIIIGHILSTLNVPSKTIYNYQDYGSPR